MPPFNFGGPSISGGNDWGERSARLRDGSTITIPAGSDQQQTLDAIFEAEAKKGLLPKHRISPELANLWGLPPGLEIDPLVARDRLAPLTKQGLTPSIGPGGVTTWGYTRNVPLPQGIDGGVMGAFVGSLEKVLADPAHSNFGDFATVIGVPALIAANPATAIGGTLKQVGLQEGSKLAEDIGVPSDAAKWVNPVGQLLGGFLPGQEPPPAPTTTPAPEKDMGLLDTLLGRGAPPPALGNNVGVPFLPPIPGIGQQGQGDPFRTPGTVGKDVDIFDLNRLRLPENIGDILDFKKMPDLGGLGVTLPKEFGLDLLRGLGLGGIGDDLSFLGGGVRLPPTQPTQSQSWLDKLVGGIKGLPSVISGGQGGLGGLLGGIRKGFGGTNDLASNLGLMSGLGLLGAGLAQQRETPDFETLFYGAPKQAQELFAAQQAAETARRQAAEDQYLGRRTEARRSLEDVLGQDTERAISRGVQTQQEKLNRQGLLGGPSGAMNEAIARVSGDVRQSQLPSLVDFLGQTETGLQGLRGGALTGDISLGRAGVERQSTLQDQQREATLRQRLLAAENKNRQRADLLRTGGELTGYGLGGSGGGQFGSAIGRSLESILG